MVVLCDIVNGTAYTSNFELCSDIMIFVIHFKIKLFKLKFTLFQSDMNEQDSHLQDEKVLKKQEKIAGDEIYYSMCSLSAPNVTEINPIVTQDKGKRQFSLFFDFRSFFA